MSLYQRIVEHCDALGYCRLNQGLDLPEQPVLHLVSIGSRGEPKYGAETILVEEG